MTLTACPSRRVVNDAAPRTHDAGDHQHEGRPEPRNPSGVLIPARDGSDSLSLSLCAIDHDDLEPRQATYGKKRALVLTHYACPRCDYSFTSLTARPKKVDMANVTLNDRYQVVKQLAIPKTIQYVIAANPHLTELQVKAIAADHGYPKIADLRLALGHLKVEADREKSLPVRTEAPEKGHRLSDDAHPTVHEPAPRNQHLVSSTPPPPARPQPVGQPMRPYDATAQLLLEGKESGFKRTVALAERIEADLIKLRDGLAAVRQKQREEALLKAAKAREEQQREQERVRALEEVRLAEEALRKAREKARRFKNHKAAGTPVPRRHPTTTEPSRTAQGASMRARHEHYAEFLTSHGLTDQGFRAWARANGHPVRNFGLVSRQVLDAYDAAHPTQAAS